MTLFSNVEVRTTTRYFEQLPDNCCTVKRNYIDFGPNLEKHKYYKWNSENVQERRERRYWSLIVRGSSRPPLDEWWRSLYKYLSSQYSPLHTQLETSILPLSKTRALFLQCLSRSDRFDFHFRRTLQSLNQVVYLKFFRFSDQVFCKFLLLVWFKLLDWNERWKSYGSSIISLFL